MRASRRILKRGGRVAFLVIEPTPGLDPAARRRAHRNGPSAIAIRTGYPSIMGTAGFVDIEAIDLTAEYLQTQRAWISATVNREAGIRAALGDEGFDQRMKDRMDTLRATEDGLLARFLYVARR